MPKKLEERKNVEKEGGERRDRRRSDSNKEQREPASSLSFSLKCLKGLRLSCILMSLGYDNGDTKPVYRELADCSQVEAV